MATAPIKEEIISQLDRLTPEQQKRVLDFTTSLVRPRGESGKEFLERTRTFTLPITMSDSLVLA